ncbi:LEAF RUST 10 DISEASE-RESISTANCEUS RECEPTOR-LIKE PROTEIN KINASE-like 1.2 [Aristolochia californica]|uniref:LEAF RUST 10 DISEASE-RESISTANCEUS RECEPTOR-LIKE PROTEIN KINASE-like 1.2 n=1 Tax=Aristolochia californica TaxID=171875 RepID=UPI0035D68F9E
MHPSSSFLLVILVSFFPLSSDSQGEEYYQKCEAQLFECGNFKDNISFPFLAGERSEFCGYPGYKLTCQNDSPEIQIGLKTYRVIGQIDYEKQLLMIVEKRFAVYNYCPFPSEDDSLPEPPLFRLTDAVLNLSLCYNCSKAIQIATPGLELVPCLEDIQGYPACYTKTPSSAVRLPCQARVLPVLIESFPLLESNPIHMMDVVKEGFQVNWLACGFECAQCRRAGGRCGIYPVNKGGDCACFCPEQSQYSDCLRDVPVPGIKREEDEMKKLRVGYLDG